MIAHFKLIDFYTYVRDSACCMGVRGKPWVLVLRNLWFFCFVLRQVSHWPGVLLGWLPTHQAPVPIFSVLGLQTHMADLAFYAGSGNGIQVLVLRRPALCPLRYLLSLLKKKKKLKGTLRSSQEVEECDLHSCEWTSSPSKFLPWGSSGKTSLGMFPWPVSMDVNRGCMCGYGRLRSGCWCGLPLSNHASEMFECL